MGAVGQGGAGGRWGDWNRRSALCDWAALLKDSPRQTIRQQDASRSARTPLSVRVHNLTGLEQFISKHALIVGWPLGGIAGATPTMRARPSRSLLEVWLNLLMCSTP
ncbi:hypothetical protein PF011_g15591 [Phytophthora fragariae]|uniref:Uncharacterized protein n=1 Tax=Phytophthora fragariae TaxID=53985 RepID=A0A6A3JQU3_9STRA|nr:hypothetical protein PF011_g15591 [Phytophthora fragariae]